MADQRRYRLAREEIGILLSFAKRPAACTAEWMARLERGVLRSELMEFFTVAGLPERTALRMVTESGSATPIDTTGQGERGAYRRALLGLVLVYVVFAVGIAIASGGSPARVVGLIIGFIVIGLLVHRSITRLSPTSR